MSRCHKLYHYTYTRSLAPYCLKLYFYRYWCRGAKLLREGTIYFVILALLTILVFVPIISPVVTNLLLNARVRSEILADFKAQANIYRSKKEIVIEVVLRKVIGVEHYYVILENISVIPPNGKTVYKVYASKIGHNINLSGSDVIMFVQNDIVEVSKYTLISIYMKPNISIDELKGEWIIKIPILDIYGRPVKTILLKTTLE